VDVEVDEVECGIEGGDTETDDEVDKEDCGVEVGLPVIEKDVSAGKVILKSIKELQRIIQFSPSNV
jgi:hypothetical protein